MGAVRYGLASSVVLAALTSFACQSEQSLEPPQACSRYTFEVGELEAGGSSGGWGMDVVSPDGTSVLSIHSFLEWDGPFTPGVYELSAINFKDCGLCLTIADGCTDGERCQIPYYAQEGRVVIHKIDVERGGPVAVTLESVVFTEVTITEDLTSTVVSGARTWCVDGDYEGTITQPDLPDESGASAPDAPEPVCVAEGNGTGIGANLADLVLTNCHGEPVNIHSLVCSEETKAVWMVASAEWCGPCHSYSDQAHLRYLNEAEQGLVLLEVIGEDGNGARANQTTCQRYADQHDLDYATTFFDPGWETFFTYVWPYPTQSGELFFPSVAIARGLNVEDV